MKSIAGLACMGRHPEGQRQGAAAGIWGREGVHGVRYASLFGVRSDCVLRPTTNIAVVQVCLPSGQPKHHGTPHQGLLAIADEAGTGSPPRNATDARIAPKGTAFALG